MYAFVQKHAFKNWFLERLAVCSFELIYASYPRKAHKIVNLAIPRKAQPMLGSMLGYTTKIEIDARCMPELEVVRWGCCFLHSICNFVEVQILAKNLYFLKKYVEQIRASLAIHGFGRHLSTIELAATDDHFMCEQIQKDVTDRSFYSIKQHNMALTGS